MTRKKFGMSLKFDTLLYLLLFAIIALVISRPKLLNKVSQAEAPASQGTFPTVTAYDLFFNIDIGHQLFQSRQVISLANSNSARKEITFLIHPDLIIDKIGFMDAQGSPLAIAGWNFGQPVFYTRLSGTVRLDTAIVRFSNTIAPHQDLTMQLDYHLKPERFQSGAGTNFYGLFVSAQNQRAIGFDSGAFPVIESNGAAPLKISIKYPDSELCGVPGQLVSSTTSPGFITSIYQTVRLYDPAFACAVYRKEQSSLNGIGVEFYLTPDQTYSAGMGAAALDYIKLYRQLFGDPGLSIFRFVYVPTDLEGGGAESKGNTVYLGKQNNIDNFHNFDTNPSVQDKFKALVGHEEFHDWNAYYSAWSGDLVQWWTEGGANFMSAWVGEMLWGEAYGRALRAQYSAGYNAQMPYLFPGTLESPGVILQGDTWKGESTLTYDYGALVWEQLRQKVGDFPLKAGVNDFIWQSSQQPGTYADFVQCLQRHTGVDVAAYLQQWLTHNPRIDLAIKQITIQPGGNQYTTAAVITVVSDKDYELFTSLGYKTDTSPDWITIPLHLNKQGDYAVKFSSQERPNLFQIDPDYRVPQTNYNNDYWPLSGPNNP
jgi:hypothetical protein